MYYLDNLDCEHKMRCVEVPRAKFFSKKMIQKLVIADMLQEEDGLPKFGKLTVSIFSCYVVYISLAVTPRFSNNACNSNVVYSFLFIHIYVVQLRNRRGTCYDKRAEPSRPVTTNMPIPGTSDTVIVGTFHSPHNQNQIGDLSSHFSLCPPNKNNTKQQHGQLNIRQIEEPEERREENKDSLGYDKQETTVCNSSELFVNQQTDGDIAMGTQGTTPSLEELAKFHGDPKVSAVPQAEHEVTGGSEDGRLFFDLCYCFT